MSFGEDEDTFWGKRIGEAVAHLQDLVLLAEDATVEDQKTLRQVGSLVAGLTQSLVEGKGHSRFAVVLRIGIQNPVPGSHRRELPADEFDLIGSMPF